MNNRLKYRVWITPWGNADPSSYMEYILDSHLHVYIRNWELAGYKEAIFQQYTGLLDKNGKEIYEGDIIEKQSVSFEDGCFWWSGTPVGFNRFRNFEIMGNIFETPQLLQNSH